VIRIISDIHLDRGDGLFTTSGGPKLLNDFLDFAGTDPLILAGDTLELYADTLEEIKAGPNWPIISQLMNHPALTYILGNHDLHQTVWPPAGVKMSVQLGPWTILHGHQYDPELNDSWKQWAVEESDRMIHELNNPTVTEISNWFANGNRDNEPLIKAVEKLGKNMIMGHTHLSADVTMSGGGRFINCGSWIDSNPYYVEIDDSYNATLKKWEG
jgi:metallophosphoesterase superfamily enzyme